MGTGSKHIYNNINKYVYSKDYVEGKKSETHTRGMESEVQNTMYKINYGQRLFEK